MKMNWKKNNSGIDSSRLSFLIGYLYDETKLKRMLKKTGSTHDFTSMTPEVKTKFLYDLTRENHASTPNSGNSDEFYSGISKSFVVLIHTLSYAVLRFTDRIQRLFVPKFYNNRKDTNFLKGLIYISEKKEIDEKYFLKGLYLALIQNNNKSSCQKFFVNMEKLFMANLLPNGLHEKAMICSLCYNTKSRLDVQFVKKIPWKWSTDERRRV